MNTPLSGWVSKSSPYHAGEQAVQERVGARDRIEQIGRKGIRPFMPDQHREFFAKLPFVIIGSLDDQRRPWASILVGQPGFMRSPDPQTLEVHAHCAWGDPLRANLVAAAPLGVLGIQLETRRRNRMNGAIVALSDDSFSIRVGQSFGNCPQYIQAREPVFVAEPSTVSMPRPVRSESSVLSAAAVELITQADTFFIATASPAAGSGDAVEGVDASHRGGKPGFVCVSVEDGRTVLTSPDFVGNFFFNTLGNIFLNPHAGILFVDFASGDLLSLTGEADVIWEGPELEAFAGALRLLRFRVTEGLAIEDGVPLRWSEPAFAPQLVATGSWEDTERAIAAVARRNA